MYVCDACEVGEIGAKKQGQRVMEQERTVKMDVNERVLLDHAEGDDCWTECAPTAIVASTGLDRRLTANDQRPAADRRRPELELYHPFTGMQC